MNDSVQLRLAQRDDLPAIVRMLADDPLGATREQPTDQLPREYGIAFDDITAQAGNAVVVATLGNEVVGCLQLTIVPRAQQARRKARIHRGRARSVAAAQPWYWQPARARRHRARACRGLRTRSAYDGCIAQGRASLLRTPRLRAVAHRLQDDAAFMTETPIRTELIAAALWRNRDCTSLDSFQLVTFAQGHILSGHVLTVFDGQPAAVFYAVFCNDAWITQNASVHVRRGAVSHTIELRRDADARWWQGDIVLEQLDGLTDVDISITPATNTLAIRRLSLAVGESQSTDAAWIYVPALTLERLPQRYTRTSQLRFHYESGNGAFHADLDVDGAGVVVQYGDIWQRIAPDA